MKLYRVPVIGLLAVCTVFISACQQKGSEQPAEDVIEVVDAAGREVDVPGNVQRVVCRGPGVLRLITYLNAAEKVAAIESGFEKETSTGRPYLLAHPELQGLPAVGAASPSPQPNPEALLTISPDVIFIANIETRIANNLQKQIGVPVVVLNYGDLGTFDNEYIFRSLRTAGTILDREERAEAVIGFIKTCQNDLLERTKDIPEDKKPSVYAGGLGYKGTHGITSTEAGYPLFELLHARSVVDAAESKDGHMFVGKEKIIEWDPDILFIDAGGLAHARDDYQKNPDWYDLLTAVKNSQVYGLMPYNYYTTNLGTALADAYYIGTVIYPEAFSDITPSEKADEIYTFLLGKPVYTQMAAEWVGFKPVSLQVGSNEED